MNKSTRRVSAPPQSAFFSAGAGLNRSPVLPTILPRCCRTSTMWNLCSGNTWAKPSPSLRAVSFWKLIGIVKRDLQALCRHEESNRFPSRLDDGYQPMTCTRFEAVHQMWCQFCVPFRICDGLMPEIILDQPVSAPLLAREYPQACLNTWG